MPTALGFGPIKDDDELLDRLGSRESGEVDGLEGLFASWTASIDEDEREQAQHVGPLGLRRVGDGEDPVVAAVQRTKVLRVPRSRAVAIVGALALTLSGGGVAAALSQAQSDLVSRVIQKATQPITGAMPGLAAQPAPNSPSDTSTVAAAWQMVDKARQAVDKGEVQKAIGMMEVIRSLAPKDHSGEQITAQVEQIEKSIAASAPAVVADAPAKKVEVTTEAVRPAEVAAREPSQSAPAAPAAPATAALSSEKPTTSPTTDPTRSSPPSTATPTPPPATTSPGPTIGNAGGEQNPGTATTTAPSVTESPSSTSSEGAKTSRPAPTEPGTEEPQERPTDAAPDATTATEAGSGASATTTKTATTKTATEESSEVSASQPASASAQLSDEVASPSAAG